ncbi:hypothetical protein BC829DRAFT_439515 [Chytridium lagenaria]|nr:hypothetical protein BC829DRAFT_439515 [Chytridium lagenaria]
MIDVQPKEINLRYRRGYFEVRPLRIFNLSELPAKIELRFISKSTEVKIDIYPRKVNPEYCKQITVVNLNIDEKLAIELASSMPEDLLIFQKSDATEDPMRLVSPEYLILLPLRVFRATQGNRQRGAWVFGPREDQNRDKAILARRLECENSDSSGGDPFLRLFDFADEDPLKGSLDELDGKHGESLASGDSGLPLDNLMAYFEHGLGVSPPLFSKASSEEKFVKGQLHLRRELENAIMDGRLRPISSFEILPQQSVQVILVMRVNGDNRPNIQSKPRKLDAKIFIRLADFDRSIQQPQFEQLLQSDLSQIPVRELMIRCSLCRSIMELGQKYINFGSLDKNEPRTKTIVLRNKSEAPLLYAIRKTGSIASGDLIIGEGRSGVIRGHGKKEDRNNDQVLSVKANIRNPTKFHLETSSLDFGIYFWDKVVQVEFELIDNSTDPESYANSALSSADSDAMSSRNRKRRPTVLLSPDAEEKIESMEQKLKIAERKQKPEKCGNMGHVRTTTSDDVNRKKEAITVMLEPRVIKTVAVFLTLGTINLLSETETPTVVIGKIFVSELRNIDTTRDITFRVGIPIGRESVTYWPSLSNFGEIKSRPHSILGMAYDKLRDVMSPIVYDGDGVDVLPTSTEPLWKVEAKTALFEYDRGVIELQPKETRKIYLKIRPVDTGQQTHEVFVHDINSLHPKVSVTFSFYCVLSSYFTFKFDSTIVQELDFGPCYINVMKKYAKVEPLEVTTLEKPANDIHLAAKQSIMLYVALQPYYNSTQAHSSTKPTGTVPPIGEIRSLVGGIRFMAYKVKAPETPVTESGSSAFLLCTQVLKFTATIGMSQLSLSRSFFDFGIVFKCPHHFQSSFDIINDTPRLPLEFSLKNSDRISLSCSKGVIDVRSEGESKGSETGKQTIDFQLNVSSWGYIFDQISIVNENNPSQNLVVNLNAFANIGWLKLYGLQTAKAICSRKSSGTIFTSHFTCPLKIFRGVIQSNASSFKERAARSCCLFVPRSNLEVSVRWVVVSGSGFILEKTTSEKDDSVSLYTTTASGLNICGQALFLHPKQRAMAYVTCPSPPIVDEASVLQLNQVEDVGILTLENLEQSVALQAIKLKTLYVISVGELEPSLLDLVSDFIEIAAIDDDPGNYGGKMQSSASGLSDRASSLESTPACEAWFSIANNGESDLRFEFDAVLSPELAPFIRVDLLSRFSSSPLSGIIQIAPHGVQEIRVIVCPIENKRSRSNGKEERNVVENIPIRARIHETSVLKISRGRVEFSAFQVSDSDDDGHTKELKEEKSLSSKQREKVVLSNISGADVRFRMAVSYPLELQKGLSILSIQPTLTDVNLLAPFEELPLEIALQDHQLSGLSEDIKVQFVDLDSISKHSCTLLLGLVERPHLDRSDHVPEPMNAKDDTSSAGSSEDSTGTILLTKTVQPGMHGNGVINVANENKDELGLQNSLVETPRNVTFGQQNSDSVLSRLPFNAQLHVRGCKKVYHFRNPTMEIFGLFELDIGQQDINTGPVTKKIVLENISSERISYRIRLLGEHDKSWIQFSRIDGTLEPVRSSVSPQHPAPTGRDGHNILITLSANQRGSFSTYIFIENVDNAADIRVIKISMEVVAKQNLRRLTPQVTNANNSDNGTSSVFDVFVSCLQTGTEKNVDCLDMGLLFFGNEYTSWSIVIRNNDIVPLDFSIKSTLPQDSSSELNFSFSRTSAKLVRSVNVPAESAVRLFLRLRLRNSRGGGPVDAFEPFSAEICINCRLVKDYQKVILLKAECAEPRFEVPIKDFLFRGKLQSLPSMTKEGETETVVELDPPFVELPVLNSFDEDVVIEVFNDSYFFDVEAANARSSPGDVVAALHGSKSFVIAGGTSRNLRVNINVDEVLKSEELIRREKYISEHAIIYSRKRPAEKCLVTFRLSFGNLDEFQFASGPRRAMQILETRAFLLFRELSTSPFHHLSAEHSEIPDVLLLYIHIVSELQFYATHEQGADLFLKLAHLLFSGVFHLPVFRELSSFPIPGIRRNLPPALAPWTLEFLNF